jgi:hypothetical protein
MNARKRAVLEQLGAKKFTAENRSAAYATLYSRQMLMGDAALAEERITARLAQHRPTQRRTATIGDASSSLPADIRRALARIKGIA